MLRTFVLREETHAQALWTFLKKKWNAMAQAGKPLAVTVSEHKAKRSAEQNKLYWSRLNQIAEQAWIDGKQFSAEAWHEFYRAKYIGMEETPDGRRIGISTTSLSVAEFSDYLERITAHAVTEFGIILE
jgi:hypothetical protein